MSVIFDKAPDIRLIDACLTNLPVIKPCFCRVAERNLVRESLMFATVFIR
jgi:hypothetical protein